MSGIAAKEMMTTSVNQTGSSSKSRPVLSRTLVMILNPLSDACPTLVHRPTCKKVGRVFEDFKTCNKHGISVLLRDAVDDIDLVGWISPFTLLIHGSAEDMDTIEQAWVGRVLKPPKGFVIKDFGEIASLDMKQIPQSQFISISETLHQIIASLNESQIRATVDCVINRLCSNFDSVVIPPLPAVRRSLDLLVKEKKLYFIDGSYYAKDAEACSVIEPPSTSGGASHRRKHELLNDGDSQYSKRKAPMRRDMTGSKIKENAKISKVTGRVKKENRGKENTGVERGEEARVTKIHGLKQERTVSTRKQSKEQAKSLLRNRVINKLISEGNYSFKELSNVDTADDGKADDYEGVRKKQIQKPRSILRKLSRFFKNKASNSGESKIGSEYGYDEDEVQPLHQNDRAKLVPGHCKETRVANALTTKLMKGFEKGEYVHKRKTSSIFKQEGEKDQEDQWRRLENKPESSVIRCNNLVKRQRAQRSGDSDVNPCSRFSSPAHRCSSSSQRAWNDRQLIRNNELNNMHSGRVERNNVDRLIDLSWSETSGSDSHKSPYSWTSSTSFESAGKSSRYSSFDASCVHSEQNSAEDISNFCSTQAICGDLELSTITLSNGKNAHQVPCSLTTEERPVIAKSKYVASYKRQSAEEQNDANVRNLQLIGVL